jgi:hypothetical protein
MEASVVLREERQAQLPQIGLLRRNREAHVRERHFGDNSLDAKDALMD